MIFSLSSESQIFSLLQQRFTAGDRDRASCIVFFIIIIILFYFFPGAFVPPNICYEWPAWAAVAQTHPWRTPAGPSASRSSGGVIIFIPLIPQIEMDTYDKSVAATPHVCELTGLHVTFQCFVANGHDIACRNFWGGHIWRETSSSFMVCDYLVWMKPVIYAHLAEKPCKFPPQLRFPLDVEWAEWKWQLGLVWKACRVPELYLIYLTWKTCLPTYHHPQHKGEPCGPLSSESGSK